MTGFVVQKAVFVALTGALPVPVFDDPPEDQPFPYVTIDQMSSDEQDTFSTTVLEWSITVSFWSDYRGKREIHDLMALAHTALHDVKLQLDSGRAIVTVVESQNVIRDQDGRTYIGQMVVELLQEL